MGDLHSASNLLSKGKNTKVSWLVEDILSEGSAIRLDGVKFSSERYLFMLCLAMAIVDPEADFLGKKVKHGNVLICVERIMRRSLLRMLKRLKYKKNGRPFLDEQYDIYFADQRDIDVDEFWDNDDVILTVVDTRYHLEGIDRTDCQMTVLGIQDEKEDDFCDYDGLWLVGSHEYYTILDRLFYRIRDNATGDTIWYYLDTEKGIRVAPGPLRVL